MRVVYGKGCPFRHGGSSRASSRLSRRVSSRSAHSPAPMLHPLSAPPSRRILTCPTMALRAATTALTRPSRSARRAAAHRPCSQIMAAGGVGMSAVYSTMVLWQIRHVSHHLRCRAAALSSTAARCGRSTAVMPKSRRC